MPDILGPLYEAVLAYCLRTHGVAATVSPPRPSPTCRETCPNAMECAALGHAPSIDVDPDVIGSTADNKFVVGFVTHWRTTGFEKKFWRTVEEIFEYQTHRPGCVGVSFVAEPVSQSDRLRRALGALAGVDLDLPSVWNDELQKAVDEFEALVKNGEIPTEPVAALNYLDEHCSARSAVGRYLQAVNRLIA